MTNKEFNAYVFEQRRQGCSDSQIARSLGMSLAHFIGRLNGVDVDKVDPPKLKKQPDKKPVDLKKSAKENDIADLGKKYQKEDLKTEDDSWMD